MTGYKFPGFYWRIWSHLVTDDFGNLVEIGTVQNNCNYAFVVGHWIWSDLYGY